MQYPAALARALAWRRPQQKGRATHLRGTRSRRRQVPTSPRPGVHKVATLNIGWRGEATASLHAAEDDLRRVGAAWALGSQTGTSSPPIRPEPAAHHRGAAPLELFGRRILPGACQRQRAPAAAHVHCRSKVAQAVRTGVRVGPRSRPESRRRASTRGAGGGFGRRGQTAGSLLHRAAHCRV